MDQAEEVSLFERYNEEIKKVVAVDEFNMKQVQMDLPVQRHYWVGRLMLHKQEVLKLKRLRSQAQQKIAEKTKQELPVGVSNRSVTLAADSHPIISKIDEQIAENELLIEYLTKVEANFRSVSYDIKNLIEIIKLETT
jgi:alpha-D-ribose 1-methylphosphonate 5-triphosphate diphosphatase PhnM